MDDSPLHDPLAVMCASVPGLVLTQTRKARVECEGQYCRGMIVTDMREHPFEAETVEFAVEVDEKESDWRAAAASGRNRECKIPPRMRGYFKFNTTYH